MKETTGEMETRNRSQVEKTLRFGADRICLWSICGDPACRRAKACRGDGRACARLVADWLAALDEERWRRPSFAAMESQIETPQELRAYRAWRNALAARR